VYGQGSDIRRANDTLFGERRAQLVAARFELVAEFDDPAVVGAIRRTLGGFLPLLGRRFIATSTLMPDWRQCAGALTVFEAGSEAEAQMLASNDPWQAIFTGRLFRLERAIVRRMLPPAGPNTQRYGGASPWPGGTFG
jgi:hypothetical protein